MVLEDRTRQYCDDCLPVYRNAQAASFTSAGRVKLQELRASGIDPAQTEEAAEKCGVIMRQRKREELEWDATHPNAQVDEVAFAGEFLPTLQRLSLTQISAATDLSQQYCSLIRRGLKVPHARHWEALRSLCEQGREYETEQGVEG